MRKLCLMLMAALAGGCASHAVRCDGRLEPINVPAVAAGTAAHPAAAAGPAAR
jgi:uncharacterized protein YceK